MNFKPLIKAKIDEFGKNFPELSIGEVMFAGIATAKKTNNFTRMDLLTISDASHYEGLTKYNATEIVGRDSDAFTPEDIARIEEEERIRIEKEGLENTEIE